MRDYSDKRGGREQTTFERRPVAKNRPRRESGPLIFLKWFLAFTAVFGTGFGAGWYVKGLRKPQPVVVAPAVKKDAPAAPAAEASAPKPDVPLTFYKTLPAGGKGAIGTGLNLKKPEPAGAPHETAPAAAAPAAPVAPAAGPAAPAAAPAADAKADNIRYVVQLASYRDKQEALSAQGKLTEKGTAAYLVESRLPDKGLWYRLRVGHKLTKSEALEMAAKFGKGAAVLPD
ncbi:hypothetical protein GMLC_01730 [Geomonas limicola]|uniref:SPOR domain-containing protein n=1 Tax=Geomonas limicola TaxID=2740186 RepID=A0A6V8N3P6_9BACT|nr:SPOR domain-containing protein [Geomonas limicola]GFO66594.1 hypothetical protein GMLC_01730 [Geomonas limicola]